jgi:hypothetical protein
MVTETYSYRRVTSNAHGNMSSMYHTPPSSWFMSFHFEFSYYPYCQIRLRFFTSSRGCLRPRTCLKLPLLSILHPSRCSREQILFYPSPFQTPYFPYISHLPLRLLLNLFLRLFRISTFTSFLVLSLFLYYANLRILFVSISVLVFLSFNPDFSSISVSILSASPSPLHLHLLETSSSSPPQLLANLRLFFRCFRFPIPFSTHVES